MKIFDFPRLAVVGLFRFYKYFISPLLPHACRFTPSCAEYGIEAVQKYGLIRGLIKTFFRLCRCQPFSGRSGWDPP